MSIDVAYIRAVLERLEGKGITMGYVPTDNSGKPFGASGVTIATGLDLGQQTKASLATMGIPSAIINRLAPYLGAKREAAQRILAREPLRLTQEEVDVIDRAVHARYIDATALLFGRASFEAAPKEVQAVAVSLHFQFGTPTRNASPALENAWNAMRRRAYRDAAEHLREPSGWSAPHQQYLKRRQVEADFLAALADRRHAPAAKPPALAGVAQGSHALAPADGHEETA